MKSFIAPLLVALITLSAGCGTRSGPYETALKLYDAEHYAQASDFFSQAIKDGTNPRQVCASYYYRGVSGLHTKSNYEAYRDFFVARAMCCWLSRNDKSADFSIGGTLTMNECCLHYAPRDLKRAGAQLDSNSRAQARREARSAVDGKYFQ